jgi:hypothetical protein
MYSGWYCTDLDKVHPSARLFYTDQIHDSEAVYTIGLELSRFDGSASMSRLLIHLVQGNVAKSMLICIPCLLHMNCDFLKHDI